MAEYKDCCGEGPTIWVPMNLGNEQIDKTLKPSVECMVCHRAAHGETQEEAKVKWNQPQ